MLKKKGWEGFIWRVKCPSNCFWSVVFKYILLWVSVFICLCCFFGDHLFSLLPKEDYLFHHLTLPYRWKNVEFRNNWLHHFLIDLHPPALFSLISCVGPGMSSETNILAHFLQSHIHINPSLLALSLSYPSYEIYPVEVEWCNKKNWTWRQEFLFLALAQCDLEWVPEENAGFPPCLEVEPALIALQKSHERQRSFDNTSKEWRGCISSGVITVFLLHEEINPTCDWVLLKSTFPFI